MKILQCKRGQIYDIGFVDPNFYNDTENNLVNALGFNETKKEILFPYNFK